MRLSGVVGDAGRWRAACRCAAYWRAARWCAACWCAAYWCAACSTPPVQPAERPRFSVETRVDEGSAALAAAEQAWSATAAAAIPLAVPPSPPAAAAAPPQEPAIPQGAVEAELRARFGSHILVRPDGRVTKQYFVSGSSGRVLLNLLTPPGGVQPPRRQPFVVGDDSAPSRSVLGRMLGEHVVEFLYLDGFEHPDAMPIRSPVSHTAVAATAPTAEANDLLVVTAKPDGLAAFESALNTFFANVPQVEIEVKVVEYSTSEGVAVGIDQLRDADGTPISGPTLTYLSSGALIQNVISNFPLTSSITGAGSTRDGSLISLGGIHDKWQLDAHLQLLESRGVADVLSNPRLTVRNGGLASVTLTTDLPYPEAKISASGQNVTANIVFRPVGITMNIRPVIAGTETVILQVFASVSAVQSFAATDPVPTPIIETKEAMTAVHVTDGKTTVIGGLVSESTFETETKFPILGDIPVLGLLFSSSSERTSKTTLEFHITPHIIQGPQGFHSAGAGG